MRMIHAPNKKLCGLGGQLRRVQSFGCQRYRMLLLLLLRRLDDSPPSGAPVDREVT